MRLDCFPEPTSVEERIAVEDDNSLSRRPLALLDWLAQVLENRQVSAVFAELSDPAGSEICLRPVFAYVNKVWRWTSTRWWRRPAPRRSGSRVQEGPPFRQLDPISRGRHESAQECHHRLRCRRCDHCLGQSVASRAKQSRERTHNGLSTLFT